MKFGLSCRRRWGRLRGRGNGRDGDERNSNYAAPTGQKRGRGESVTQGGSGGGRITLGYKLVPRWGTRQWNGIQTRKADDVPGAKDFVAENIGTTQTRTGRGRQRRDALPQGKGSRSARSVRRPDTQGCPFSSRLRQPRDRSSRGDLPRNPTTKPMQRRTARPVRGDFPDTIGKTAKRAQQDCAP